MRLILSLTFLAASIISHAQSYTITERVCRMWIDNPSRTVEALLLDRIDWRRVGSPTDQYEFSDGITTIRLKDENLANYPTVDSLISQIEAWIDSCAIPPNLWPIQVCDTSNITVNGVVTDAATDASNDGEIAITTYGGQSPYTYAWTGPGGYTSTDEDITGLDNGTYTVTVTDANGCTGSQSFEVGIAACDGVTITFTATVTDEVTEGAEDGEIEINTTSGGTGPYTYAWTGPNGYTSSSEDITDLADGDYTVTATDANGCTGDSTFTVGPGFPCSVTNITFTAVVTDESIDQQNDGEIDLTTAGGAVPYTWSWRGPKGYTASTEDISNLGDGNYTVTATDANNCQGDTTFTIDPGPTICDTSNILFNAVVVDETIEGLEDGSIDLTTYGGTPPYTWLWRGPTGFRETTEDISNLADGDYTVTVTDNNGCQGDTTYTIDPGFPCDTTNIGFVAVITNASDSAVSDGEIDLTTYGGSKVYTWAWTGPGGYTATTEDITGLAEGEYTVTATDSNNCFSDTTITVGVTPVETLFANTRSIDLDGTSEYVSVADADSLSFTDGAGNDEAFSVSMWVYYTGTPSDYLVCKSLATGNQREWQTYLSASNNPRLYLLHPDASAQLGIKATNNIPSNKWVHLAFTYDGSETNAGQEIYINGVQEVKINDNAGSYTGMTNGTSPLEIGSVNGGSGFFAGKIDQVCIFRNVELTQEEIKELMTIRDVTQHSRYDSLVLYHEYDYPDSTGTDGIVDLSPAGNHGTMQAGQYADLQECITWPYPYQLDTSANWENLTPMQSAADTSFGGFSWDFDGGADEIGFSADADWNFQYTDSITLNIWLNKTRDCGVGCAEIYVGNSLHSGQEDGWWIGNNVDNRPEFKLKANATASADIISRELDAELELNKTYMLTVTYNGSSDANGITLYVNGQEEASTVGENTASGSITYTTPLVIGAYNGLNYWYQGEIFEFSGYDKVLTADEILALYNDHGNVNPVASDVADNLLGYWTAYNSTNTSNGVINQAPSKSLAGTPQNMAADDFVYSYTRGLLNSVGSFDYDGTAEWDSIPDAANLSFGNGSTDSPFTLSLWVNSDDYTDKKWMGKWRSSNNEWALGTEAGDRIEWRIYDLSSGSQQRIKSTAGYTADQGDWIHWVVSYDGRGGSSANAGMKIYRNSVAVATVVASADAGYVAMEDLGAYLELGTYNSTSYYNGRFNNISIINKELELCEIQELYNNGSPVDITAVTFAADVVSHWRLDQTDDPEGTITDVVGTNDGTHKNGEAGDLKTSPINGYPTN